MTEQQLLLKDMVERLFADLAASRPENDDAEDVFAARWAQFEELGLQGLLIPEADGGFDGSGTESWLVCHAAGRHAIDLPVIEAIIAAGMLAGAGLPIPAGVLSIASRVEGKLAGNMFEGRLYGVPWGRQADHVVAIVDDRLICVPTVGAEIDQHVTMADEPRDEIRVEPTDVASAAYRGIAMLHHGALARAAQIAGAARSAMDL
ncbi:MAG: acyl-CoA dehydrogenase family protein, partial [Sphingomicrobium sp.]